MEVECVKAKRKIPKEIGLFEPEDERWSCEGGSEVICHRALFYFAGLIRILFYV